MNVNNQVTLLDDAEYPEIPGLSLKISPFGNLQIPGEIYGESAKD